MRVTRKSWILQETGRRRGHSPDSAPLIAQPLGGGSNTQINCQDVVLISTSEMLIELDGINRNQPGLLDQISMS